MWKCEGKFVNENHRIILPYPPSTNTLYANRRSGGRIKTREGHVYKEAVGLLLRRERVPLLTGPVSLVIRLYRPQKRGDLDGHLKAIIDAMSGIAFVDDEQVERIDARRFDDKANPRAEVMIMEAAHERVSFPDGAEGSNK